MKINLFFLLGVVLCCCSACGNNVNASKSSPGAVEKSELIGSFNADSAYSYVARQVSFGPRVPGSDGHKACRQWLLQTLGSFNPDTLIVQDAEVTAYNGDILPISNIFAGFNMSSPKRVLLVAHWDTRPWADKESTAEDRTKPIPGANDGASGVGVLLEIARNLALKAPQVGVDILLVDAEDYGQSEGFAGEADSWCLGSQYWVKHMTPYSMRNRPVYGILLDMVGAAGAQFHYEIFSQSEARVPTIKVWSEADRLGYSDVFVREKGSPVIDDHIVLTRAGIPTTDIIESQHPETTSFHPSWHTLGDDMSNIDRRTLGAVGNTVLNVVYKEKLQ